MVLKFIYYIESSPLDINSIIEENPIAFVPFGALEWHGPHNILGVDSIKSIEICKRVAEKTGGVIFPCVNWGAFKTLKFPFTFSFSKTALIKMTRKIAKQLYNMGFKIIILLTGHYPLSQVKQVRKTAKKISKKHNDCFALGIPEQALVTDLNYFGDHAAEWETSIMMAIDPEYVKLERIPKGLNFPERCIKYGIFGKDPAEYASKEKGKNILIEIVNRLSNAILKVKETKSIEFFNKIYENYNKAMKKLRNLKKLYEIQGIKNNKEALEYVKWLIFKRKKNIPNYEFKKK
ncbi:MAG: creatininase family protein [Promethearchaeota archaeon]